MKAVSILVLICFVFTLTGCSTVPPAEKAEELASPAGYFLSREALPTEMPVSTVQLALGDSIYLAGEGIDGNPIHGIFKEDSFQRFALSEDIQYIYAACLQDGQIAVLCGEKPTPVFKWLRDSLQNPAAGQSICSIEIKGYSEAGELLYELPLSGQTVEQGAEFFAMEFQEESFYLLSPYHFIEVDLNGNAVNSIETYSILLEENAPGHYISLCRLGDELFLTACGEGSSILHDGLGLYPGAAVCRLNRETFALEPVFREQSLYPIGMGIDLSGNIFLFDNDSLYSLEQDSAEPTRLFQWADIKLYSILFNRICPVSEGRYLLCSSRADKLLYLCCGDDREERTELRLGCEQKSGILSALVEEFNLVNEDYYISIELLNNSDISRAELIKGNTPDIFYLYGNDFLGGIKKDVLFEDLNVFLDRGSIQEQDILVPALRDALEENGKLYILPFDYLIWTMRSPLKIANTENMRMSDLIDAIREQEKEAAIFQPGYSRSALWQWLCELSVEAFVDPEKGEAHFDSPEYLELLEVCMSVPENSDDFDANALLNVEQVGNILRVQAFDTLYGEQYTFTGCPTGGLSSGSCFEIVQSFAMSASSDNKEGVWAFFEFILSPNIINLRSISGVICLPASKKQLDYLIDLSTGDGYRMYMSFEKSYASLQISEYSAEQLVKLIERTDTVMNTYPDIVRIMQEEAEKYFNGLHSAEEAAAITQARSNIAMAEKYG